MNAHRGRLSSRERWLIRGVLVAVGVLAAILAVAIATAGQSSAHGCIHATIAGPVGAEEVNQCGPQARATCASVASSGTFPPQAVKVIRRECRRAGLPFG